jgi:hypothetical protein
VTHRKKIVVTTRLPQINDEPIFNVDTRKGAMLQRRWKGNVVVTNSYQGSGKTYWLNRAIVNHLRRFPDSKILYVCPFTTLTEAATKRLRSALVDGVKTGQLSPNHGFCVKQYKEHRTADEKWNVLVCHPRSLKHWSFKGVNMIAIDEVTSMLFQIGSWGNLDASTRDSINGCTDLLRKLCAQASWLLLSCAQLNDERRETLCELLNVSPEAEVIHYAHETTGPRIPVVVLTCENVIRGKIWADVLAGHRVAVSVRHAAEANRMHRWLQKEVHAHNKALEVLNVRKAICVQSVAWTAQWCQSRHDTPGKDATQWLTLHNIQVVFYTNSLSPGMSIDHTHGHWYRVYMHISNKGTGANSLVMGQMAKRFRNPAHVTIYMYVQQMVSSATPVSSSSTPSAIIASTADRAMKAVLADYPQERELYLNDHGEVVEGLKAGGHNDLRLQCMYDRMDGGVVLYAEHVVSAMGNAYIVRTDTNKVQPSPSWLEVLASEKTVTKTMHLSDDELPNADDWEHGTFPPSQLRARRYYHIASTVPPEFVAVEKLPYSLTPAAFECIHNKYQHLRVIQELARLNVQSLLHNIDLYAHAGEMSHEEKQGAYGMDPIRRAVVTICALIAVIETRADTTALTGNLSLDIRVTDGSSKTVAYQWMKKHWKVTRTLPSRSLPLPMVIPHQDATEEWTSCLQRVLKEQTGLNWRKHKNKRQRSAAHFSLTPLSMWAKLGIDVNSYVAWYRSSHARQFGIIRKSVQCCVECDGVGDDVVCLRQNNIWRCSSRQMSESWPHREPFQPLDVHPAWRSDCHVVIQDDASEHNQELHSVCKQLTAAIDRSLIDRLLGHLGFKHGAKIGAPGVSHPDMVSAWSMAIVDEQDVHAIKVHCNIDLIVASNNRTYTQQLITDVTTILAVNGLQLNTRRHSTNGKRHRKYYVMPLP